MPPKKTTKKKSASKESSSSFTAAERAAMKERAAELKAEAKRADGERVLLDKVAEMKGTDRAIAEALHRIITETAPGLTPKTWYGMPAYAKDGKVVCFFQAAGKFESRYATLGFSDQAALDDGAMWPTSFALTKVGPSEEKKIRTLVKGAVG